MSRKINLDAIARTAARLAKTKKEADKAVQRARGTLRRRIVPEARRDIQAEYNLKAQRINKGLRATHIANGVELVGSKRGIGLIEFGARGTKAGVRAKIKTGSQTDDLPGNFIAPMLGGNRHVVERYGAKRIMRMGRYAGKRRQPLYVLYGPSIAQMLRRPGRADRLAVFAQDVLTREIRRLLG